MARVLVVEPDRRIRQFIAGILGDFGHQVEQCSGVAEARQRLQQSPFDVVASDLPLERDGGRGRAPPGSPEIVSLSGGSLHAVAAWREPPVRLHEKPFRFADLHNLVRAVGSTETGYALAA